MAVLNFKTESGEYVPLVGVGNLRPFRNGFIFGDSFISGKNGTTGETTTNLINNTINDFLGINLINKGVGGQGWCGTTYTNRIAYDEISNTNLSSAEIVVLCFGTNDFSAVLKDEQDPTNENTIMFQINKCVNYILTQKPDCIVIIVAPWKQIGDYNKKPSTSDHSKEDLSNEMSNYCKANFIPFIDIYSNPINDFNSSILIGTDGLHPTDTGYKLLGRWLAGKILNFIG